MEIPTIVNPSNTFYQWTHDKLLEWGVPAAQANLINLLVLSGLLLLGLGIIGFVVRKLLVNVLITVAKRSATKFDDHLVRNRAMAHLARLVPLIISIQFIPVIFSDFPTWIGPVRKFLDILLVVGWVLLFRALFRSIRDHLRTKKGFEEKPLDSYMQVINIFMFFIGGIIIFSMVTGQSPWAFLGALGAASAILLLVFKDTIMGFVASIQVSTNDMVRVGDWIEMPKYNADGDVIEINLNTVKVRNWDKTITTVPTHYLVTDSFKNWRGMHSAGGRRIKRSINVKISSIRYLEKEEIEQLKKIQLLASYIDERRAEIDQYNAESGADPTMPVNGRKMTNVGLYRQYINRYTEQHPLIHKGYTMVVRQLQPTEYGLPIELYMYTSNTKWAVYENAMADIFDHLLASIKYFGLEVFEAPASDDIRSLGVLRRNGEKGVGVPIRQGEG
ncbi:mechanosensitive ion channel family protein [Parapedobacter indicus]|uniref:Mechanosensing system component YbdG n=1 Tax=Parapedobacter indicus TaxID=1477437 RepID=A0A1I3QJI8_9SPHI|nr:mechanosensitive ion channel domain-containing protein [Parapedobacter indicus]PPL00133.1 miniconductance mechanosensitive channel [Parapedobacter indicus]SFJ33940.1 miniconductance mechanosensitive channel [Parapedobacter indicus]